MPCQLIKLEYWYINNKKTYVKIQTFFDSIFWQSGQFTLRLTNLDACIKNVETLYHRSCIFGVYHNGLFYNLAVVAKVKCVSSEYGLLQTYHKREGQSLICLSKNAPRYLRKRGGAATYTCHYLLSPGNRLV